MYLSATIASFFLTVFFIRLFRDVAIRIELVDISGGRKCHQGEIPLTGGIAMALAFGFATLILDQSMQHFRALFAGVVLLIIVGVLDDLHELRARHKLIAQALAGVFLVAWGGLQIDSLGDLFSLGPVTLGDWAIPFTFVCVVGFINAVNMADGSDGLAGGMVFVMLAWLIALALLAGIPKQAMLPALLAAAVAGFLCFNFPIGPRTRATVFMGDSGSMFLGFAVAWFAISIAGHAPGIPPIVIAWVLALPVFDTVSLMVRRVLKGHPVMSPDREHLHHIFERTGFSRRACALIPIGVAALMGGCAVIGWRMGVPEWVLTVGLALVFAAHLYFVHHAWRIMRAMKRHPHEPD